jgi:hypothetical protein
MSQTASEDRCGHRGDRSRGIGKVTHVLDGLTSSTFRSNWCHVGVVVEGVRDICAVLKASNHG